MHWSELRKATLMLVLTHFTTTCAPQQAGPLLAHF